MSKSVIFKLVQGDFAEQNSEETEFLTGENNFCQIAVID